jgi:5'-nucleotidase / UDP-sugar diphosphatase
VSGKHLKQIFAHIMRGENRDGEGECYQVSKGISAVYSDREGKLKSLSFKGKHVDDEQVFRICLQGYHVSQAKAYLNISQEELRASGKSKVVSTSAKAVLEEFVRNNQNIDCKVEGRLVYEK